jgi:hypothetical protein
VRIAVLLAVAAVLTAGCAQIRVFAPSPRVACPGDVVTLSWDARGYVVLGSEPMLPQMGPRSSSGREEVRPTQSMRFTLSVWGLFSSDHAENDVTLTPRSREFGDLARCASATGPVELALPLSAPQVVPLLKVTSVTNMNPRTVTISKDGISTSVPSRGSTSDFRNQTAAGTWSLRVAPDAGEACASTLTALASRLTFKLDFACGE